jgi:preprotein translocase subunit SecY
MIMEAMHVPQVVAGFFGGTSLLILVGVMLDTMRQVETHLIQRHYDGFLRKGKIRGRFERAAYNKGNGISDGAMVWLSTSAAIIIIVAVVILIFNK